MDIARSKKFTVMVACGLTTALVRCGGDGEPRGDRRPQGLAQTAAPEGTPPPPAEDKPPAADRPTGDDAPGKIAEGERRFTNAELMTLVGLSATQSQSAYGHCRDVLAQGIYDRYHDSITDTVKHALTERFCTMAEDEFAEKVRSYFNEKRGNSVAGSHDDSFGLKYLDYIELQLGTAGTSSSASSQEVTRDQALDTARKWKTSHCGDASSSQASDFEHTVLSEQIDPLVVDAWRTCISKASNGFFCESSESDETVSIRLHWDPNAVQATLLPRLSLRLQTTHNLKLASTEVPGTLGTGSGISVTYRRIDPKKPSVFEALASDAGHQVDFSCSIQVSKVLQGKIMNHESCGVREFGEGRGSVCGVEHVNRRRDQRCGVESFKELESPHCGVQAYNAGTSLACPGSISRDLQELTTSAAPNCTLDAPAPAPCPEGYMDRGVADRTRTCRSRTVDADWSQFIRRTRTCERPEVKSLCRLPEFGVEHYNLCRHAAHGVERYKECEDATFGVTYKLCRNVAFGTTYNKCFVPDTMLN